MDQTEWTEIDHYFVQKLLPPDTALNAALQTSADAGLPSINVAPNQGKFLHLLAKIQGAKRILEIGTLGGYSTIWLARALPADGMLISLEANADYAELARKNIDKAGLTKIISVITGDARESLEKLAAEQTAPFDFIFIDADKTHNPDYLKLALKLSRPGSIIIADNVVRKGRVGNPDCHDEDVIGIHRYFDLLQANRQLDSTAIQTLGVKGWDGFALTIVSKD